MKKIRRFTYCAGEMPLRTFLFAFSLLIVIALGLEDAHDMWAYAGCLFSLLVFAILGIYAVRTAMIIRKIKTIGMPAKGRELRAVYTGRLAVVGLISSAVCQPMPFTVTMIECLIFSSAIILLAVDFKPALFPKRP